MHAELDENTCPTGVKIPDQDMKDLDNTGILTRHDFHGESNYSLNPDPTAPPRHARPRLTQFITGPKDRPRYAAEGCAA